MTNAQHIATKNTELREQMAAALKDRGYLAVYAGGTKIHSATDIITGHEGRLHPRPLCMPHTPRTFASAIEEQDTPVTCKKCLGL